MIHFVYLKILLDIIKIFYNETVSVIEKEKEEQHFLETFEKVFQIERKEIVENAKQAHKEHFSYQNMNDKICSILERKIHQYQQENHIDITYAVNVIPSREFPCIHIVFPHKDKYFSIVLSIEKHHNDYHVVVSTSDKDCIYMIDFTNNLSKYKPIELQEGTQEYSSISVSEIIECLMNIVK